MGLKLSVASYGESSTVRTIYLFIIRSLTPQQATGNAFAVAVQGVRGSYVKMAKKPETHDFYMQLALDEARKAGQNGEVPIGAILVAEDDKILAAAYNSTISLSDPSAHAEILALRKAGNKLKNYRLLNTTLYVTMEPCLMCMGAIVHARLKRLVFGAYDPKWGAAGSLYNFAEDKRLNHKIEIISGICLEECKNLIRYFFKEKRKNMRL